MSNLVNNFGTEFNVYAPEGNDKKWEYLFLIFYLFMLIYFAMHWFSDFSFYKS